MIVFSPAPNAMSNIPENLKPDLLGRMQYLFTGITGEMAEWEYTHLRKFYSLDIGLSDQQSEKLIKYSFRAYGEMCNCILDCANYKDTDWMQLVRVLVKSERYFRILLEPEYDQIRSFY